MQSEIITGIDLGSKTIRIAVGELSQQDKHLKIIGTVEEESGGISKGVISDLESTISHISKAVEKAEKIIGAPIRRASVGISGTHIISEESKGVIAVSRADGEISQEDVARALEAAQTIATPPNYDILHIIARSYTVDSQPGIKEPVGMTGSRLEVDAQVILGLTNQIKTLTKALNRAGIEISDLIFIILASAEAVLTREQKELGVVLVNLGESTTSMAVFEEGDILKASVLPIGCRHITADIAIGLRIPMRLAEKIKINYGTCRPEEIPKYEQIDLSELDEKIKGVVSRKEIAEIIVPRCEEICGFVDDELKKIDRSGKLPAGVVLTGAGAKLLGISELAKRIFRLPSSIGFPRNLEIASDDRANDPSFSAAIGLILWTINNPQTTSHPGGIFRPIKDWIKGLLPR